MVARVSSTIRYPEAGIPGYHLVAWSDAAGGTWGSAGTGLGMVFPAIQSWAYMPWPAWLQHGGMNDDGVRFASKLTLKAHLGLDLQAGGGLQPGQEDPPGHEEEGGRGANGGAPVA